jgi:hypothetical protein
VEALRDKKTAGRRGRRARFAQCSKHERLKPGFNNRLLAPLDG